MKDSIAESEEWFAKKGYNLYRSQFQELLALRGNIRVFCRIKPITNEEKARFVEMRKQHFRNLEKQNTEKHFKDRFHVSSNLNRSRINQLLGAKNQRGFGYSA